MKTAVEAGARARRRAFQALWWSLLFAVSAAPVYALPRLGSDSLSVVALLMSCLATVLVFVAQISLCRTPLAIVGSCLILWFCQNVLLGTLNQGADEGALAYALYYSNALPMLGLAAVVCVRSIRPQPGDFWIHATAAMLAACLAVQLIVTSAPLAASVPALRNFVATGMLFYLGYAVGQSGGGVRAFLHLYWLIALLIALFGLVEWSVLQDEFWVEHMNVDVVIGAKHLRPSMLGTGVPSDFYSPVAGTYYRRLVSFIGTPVTTGYLLAFAAFALLMMRGTLSRVARTFSAALFMLCLGLTLVKGGLQILVTALVVYRVAPLVRSRRYPVVALTLIVGGLVLVAAVIIEALPFGSTASVHADGLLGVVRGLPQSAIGTMLLGNGLGTGGTLSGRLGAQVEMSSDLGAESGIGSALYQLGLIGAIVYVAFHLSLAARTHQIFLNATDESDRLLARGLTAGGLALLVNAFFQENAGALIPASPFLIGIGLLTGAQRPVQTLKGRFSRRLSPTGHLGVSRDWQGLASARQSSVSL